MNRRDQPANVLAIRILAVLLSVIIWTWIQLNETTSSIQRVSLAFDRPEKLLEVEDLPKTISVELSGAKGRLRQLEKIPLLLPVDLSEGHEGENSIALDIQSILGLPDGIQVERLTPPILDITLAKPFIIEIPIRANLVGSINEDYKVSRVTITPPTISVRGAEASLNQIQDIPTRILNIGDINTNTSFKTQVVLPKSTLTIQQENVIDVKVELAPKNMQSVISGVLINLNSLEWNISPNEVSMLLSLPSDSSITSEQIQLQVDVNSFLKITDSEPVGEIELDYSKHPELFSIQGLGDLQATIKNIDPSVLTLTPVQ